jgi:predicted amidohydrolase YtcJ
LPPLAAQITPLPPLAAQITIERPMPLPAALALVLTHAHVLTMSPAQPTASVLAIVDGRVAYAGDDEAAARRAAGPDATRIDLGGKTVMPGFNDAHVHFGYSITAYGRRGIFFHQPTTKSAFIAAVGKFARGRSDSGWLFVTINALPDGIRGPRDLDFVTRPLFVISEHGALFNTRGLRDGKISADEAPGGFVRGALIASELEHLITLTPHAELVEGARNFLAELAKDGITSVQLIDELPDLFEELRKGDALTARVRLVPFGYRWNDFTHHDDWRGGDPTMVRVEGVKYFYDSWARIGRFELQRIFDAVTGARRPVIVHVISRRALSSLLDKLERMAGGDGDKLRLFRFDHVDEATRADADRLAKDGIMVCSNPSMIPEWASEHAFPMRTLLDAGVKLCIGTDWLGDHVPLRPLPPLVNVQLAATHAGYGNAERITVAEALAGYTTGSAAAEGEAREKGMLVPGMLADLIVLSADPLATAPEHVRDIDVLMTMVGGRVVYRRGGFGAPPASSIGAPVVTPTSIGAPRAPELAPPRH